MAIRIFAYVTYLEDDNVDVLEVLEDFLLGLREWSRSEGEAWDDGAFLHLASRVAGVAL